MERASAGVNIWARAAGDPTFRDALIRDPLRAIAATSGVSVSPEQVRLLEEMDAAERSELVIAVMHRIHAARARGRYGRIGPDGRMGGMPDPPGPASGSEPDAA